MSLKDKFSGRKWKFNPERRHNKGAEGDTVGVGGKKLPSLFFLTNVYCVHGGVDKTDMVPTHIDFTV